MTVLAHTIPDQPGTFFRGLRHVSLSSRSEWNSAGSSTSRLSTLDNRPW